MSRYNLRPVSDRELQKVNNRIDEKIARRRQQEHASKSKPEPPKPQPSPPQPSSTSKTTPSRSLNTTRSDTNPPSRNDEYSIFRDPPAATASLPPRTRVTSILKNKHAFVAFQSQQDQSRTLGEELGLNFSLDPEPTQRPQSAIRDFKVCFNRL